MGIFDRLFGKKTDRPSAYNPAGPIVLVVRDPEGSLATALKGEGREISAFTHDEPRLLERLVESEPTCVVLQIDSAGTNGFLVTRSLKKDARLRTVPLVLFSAEVDQETFNQHRKLRTHADAYVTSADPDEIAAAVRPLVSSSLSG